MTSVSDKVGRNQRIHDTLHKLLEQKYLLYSLVATGFAILVSESIGKEVATTFTDWFFLPVSGSVVIISLVLLKIQGLRGNHGKAWICFIAFAACWFIAETLWTSNELIFHTKPFPSNADFFYLAGYPAYFVFAILYLKPVKNSISKNMVLGACIVSAAILIPNLYMTFDNNSGEDKFAIALGATYPIADAIILVPALLGVTLFLGGKVNFLWTLMLIGVLLNVVADTGFQYFSLDDSYYSGHPVDIFFMWAYIIFAFGAYDYVKIFRRSKDEHRFVDQEKMR